MSVNWGGIGDFFTAGLTDFDQQGSWDKWQFNPISGGVDQKWGPEPSIGTQAANMASDYLSQAKGLGSGTGTGSGSGSNPSGMDQQSGIEKITDGLYLYNPAKFLGDYQAQVQQGSSKSSGGGIGGFLKTAFNVAAPIVIKSAMAGCDMRLKTDVSPLKTTDVNDDLAEMAFFVKGLRECA